MAKKKRNTLKQDVSRLVKFKKSIGQKADFDELYKKYKSKGKTYLDNRSFRFTDDKGKFINLVNYSDQDVQEILNLAKTKRQKKSSKSDIRNVTQKATIDIFQKRKKENPNITFREVLKEVKDKNIFEIDSKSLVVYNSLENHLSNLYNENNKLKITITDSEGKKHDFSGKAGLIQAQKMQSEQLSLGWKKIRDEMKENLKKETNPIKENIEFYENQLEVVRSLKKEGLTPVFDDFGEVSKTIKFNKKISDRLDKAIVENLDNLEDDLQTAKEGSITPSRSIPTNTINDSQGNPLAVGINYSDIRGN